MRNAPRHDSGLRHDPISSHHPDCPTKPALCISRRFNPSAPRLPKPKPGAWLVRSVVRPRTLSLSMAGAGLALFALSFVLLVLHPGPPCTGPSKLRCTHQLQDFYGPVTLALWSVATLLMAAGAWLWMRSAPQARAPSGRRAMDVAGPGVRDARAVRSTRDATPGPAVRRPGDARHPADARRPPPAPAPKDARYPRRP